VNVHAYGFDPETLHEIPDHPEELGAWLAAQTPDSYESWSQVGTAARLLRRLDEAERACTTALTFKRTIAGRLRLAHVLQWQGRFDEANAEFDRILPESGPVLHFAHQHAGKCRYDEGEWALALAHFHESLRLRQGGDEGLIASAALAVDAADACLTAAAVAAALPDLPSTWGRALRHHHAKAQAAAGDVKAATDRIAARLYRPMSTEARARLIAALPTS
jgi:tetratricopeptide (TPR) repeat protein